MFKDIPVEVGVIYEGERIRRNDMQIELAYPQSNKSLNCKSKPMNEIEDGKSPSFAPDIKDMKEARRISVRYSVGSSRRKPDQGLEGVIERRIHGYLNYIRRLHAPKPAL
jgi:acetyl-CoA decarbonylase/synthase complex subunit beta